MNLAEIVKQNLKPYKIISKENTKVRHGWGSSMESAFQKGLYVFGLKDGINGIGSISALDMQGFICTYHHSDLEALDISSQEAYEFCLEQTGHINKKAKAERELKMKELNDKSNKPEPFDINGQFSKPNKETGFANSFVQKGIFLEDGSFLPYYDVRTEAMCFPMKQDSDNEDIILYIPKQWLDILGYDETFVKTWVSHIIRLTGSDIKDLGLTTITKFVETKNINGFLTRNSFYSFQLNPSNHYMVNYLIFNLLRYLYHYQYNNLPGLTIQLMDYYKTDDFFKCLMLAHYSNVYPIDFGIGAWFDGKSISMPSIEQDAVLYLKNLKETKTITHSLDRVEIDVKDYEKIKTIFSEKRYNDLLSCVKLLTVVPFNKDSIKSPKKKGGYESFKKLLIVNPAEMPAEPISLEKKNPDHPSQCMNNTLNDYGLDSVSYKELIKGNPLFDDLKGRSIIGLRRIAEDIGPNRIVNYSEVLPRSIYHTYLVTFLYTYFKKYPTAFLKYT